MKALSFIKIVLDTENIGHNVSDIKTVSFKKSVSDVKTIGHNECIVHNECVKHTNCVLHTLLGTFSSLEYVFGVTSWTENIVYRLVKNPISLFEHCYLIFKV